MIEIDEKEIEAFRKSTLDNMGIPYDAVYPAYLSISSPLDIEFNWAASVARGWAMSETEGQDSSTEANYMRQK
jgi:hypothetical protein